MPNVYKPVTEAFLSTVRACQWVSDSDLVFPASPPITLHARLNEAGAWSLGTATAGAKKLSLEAHAELFAASLDVDGSGAPTGLYVLGGEKRALYLTDIGAALPGDPPPPPPPA
jgi:hypothetical protein